MKNQEIIRQANRINDLLLKANELFSPEDEMRSEIAKYTCVLCSGFLENSISILFSTFIAANTSNQEIINYAQKCLNKIQNPKKDKILEIANYFNFEWQSELREFMLNEERGSSINYIITERHRIAHGDNSEITVNRLQLHFTKAVDVVAFIEEKLQQ